MFDTKFVYKWRHDIRGMGGGMSNYALIHKIGNTNLLVGGSITYRQPPDKLG